MRYEIKLLLLTAVVLLVAGCGAIQEGDGVVPVSDLIADPETYHGAEVCAAGVYVSGFEVSALGAATETRDGLLYLVEPAIWVEDMSAVEQTGECVAEGAPQGYKFCEATVCGTFEAGRQFGHLGGYNYQIR